MSVEPHRPILGKQPAPELFKMLMSLYEHHRALGDRIAARRPTDGTELADAMGEVRSLLPDLNVDELTFEEVRHKIIEAKEFEQAKELKVDDDPKIVFGDPEDEAIQREKAKELEVGADLHDTERVWRLQELERKFDPQSLAEMLRTGEEVTDDNYEAVRAESDTYRNHPIYMICREVNDRSELSPDVVLDVAERLCDGNGLGAWTEYGEAEWDRETRKLVQPVVRHYDDLEYVPKIFKELDRDGSTNVIWEELCESYPGVVAEVWPAKGKKKHNGSLNANKLTSGCNDNSPRQPDTKLDATQKMPVDSLATACLIKNQEWTHEEVARAIGCHIKTLTQKRCPMYFATRARLKTSERLLRGTKDGDGNIEAWEEE